MPSMQTCKHVNTTHDATTTTHNATTTTRDAAQCLAGGRNTRNGEMHGRWPKRTLQRNAWPEAETHDATLHGRWPKPTMQRNAWPVAGTYDATQCLAGGRNAGCNPTSARRHQHTHTHTHTRTSTHTQRRTHTHKHRNTNNTTYEHITTTFSTDALTKDF